MSFKYGEAFEQIHFKHDVTYFVPCFIINPGDIKQSLITGEYGLPHNGYPTYTYNMASATTDEQMAWSFEPDYVLELKGTFDAKTEPWFSPDIYDKHGNGD